MATETENDYQCVGYRTTNGYPTNIRCTRRPTFLSSDRKWRCRPHNMGFQRSQEAGARNALRTVTHWKYGDSAMRVVKALGVAGIWALPHYGKDGYDGNVVVNPAEVLPLLGIEVEAETLAERTEVDDDSVRAE